MKKKLLLLCLLSANLISSEYLYVKKIAETRSSSVQNSFVEDSKFSCHINHCYAIKNGTIWFSGQNSNGQLGINVPTTTTYTVFTDTGFEADYVVAGNGSGYAIKNGNLWVTGNNTYGQLGLGNTNSINVWTDTGISNVSAVYTTNWDAYVIINGYVWSTGRNNFGQLGLGNITPVNEFTNTNFSADYLVTGTATVFAMKGNNLYGVGSNNSGEFGLGDFVSRSSFTNLEQTFDKVYMSGSSAYGIRDGVIYSTGWNSTGDLALGSSSSRNIWETIGATGDILAANHRNHVYKLKDGIVYSAGSNYHGQLGLGYTITSFVGRSHSYGVPDWTTIGVEAEKIFAFGESGFLVSNGILYAVGNNFGQLGIGSTSNRSSWTEVPDFMFDL